MSAIEQLRKEAESYQKQNENALFELSVQRDILKAQLSEIEAQIDATKSGRKARDLPEVNGVPACPSCWTGANGQHLLRTRRSEDENDLWECPCCRAEFETKAF